MMSDQRIEQPSLDRNLKLLTGDEVASILKISRSFAFTMMKRGDIPTVRLGRSVRVRLQDLEKFVDENVSGQRT